MKTLTIKLTSPLQSFGNEASFDRRTSQDAPSKSAVMGMLAAALGYSRDDNRIHDLYTLSFAVRIDQPGSPLTDFQTVEWKEGRGRKVTYRDYLQDAVFVVAIGSNDTAFIDQIKTALAHPYYQLYLGRRANVPAGPLQVTEFPDDAPLVALKALPWQAARWYQRRQPAEYAATIIADAELTPTHRTHLVKDVAESSSQRDRRFTFRAVGELTTVVANPAAKSATQHDIWASL